MVGKAVDVRRVTAVYESGGCTERDRCLRKQWMYGERTTSWERSGCTERDRCLRKRWMYGEWQMFTKAVDGWDGWESGGCLESDSCLRKRWMYGE